MVQAPLRSRRLPDQHLYAVIELGVSPFFLPFFCGSADANTARRGTADRADTDGRCWSDPMRDAASSRGAHRLIGESGSRGLCGSACTGRRAVDRSAKQLAGLACQPDSWSCCAELLSSGARRRRRCARRRHCSRCVDFQRFKAHAVPEGWPQNMFRRLSPLKLVYISWAAGACAPGKLHLARSLSANRVSSVLPEHQHGLLAAAAPVRQLSGHSIFLHQSEPCKTGWHKGGPAGA